jgi:hypothetical protein
VVSQGNVFSGWKWSLCVTADDALEGRAGRKMLGQVWHVV